MFKNKVEDQELDILHSLFRNVHLKKKCDTLDTECKRLADKIISSQLSRAEENEHLIPLRKQLTSLRQEQAQKLNELNVYNKAIESMLAAVQDIKGGNPSSAEQQARTSIKDDELLKFKDDMIKCLQEELVQMRLNAAENQVLIRELTETKNSLEQDNDNTVKQKPDTINVLQDELMAAKIRVARVHEEFEAIRRFLGSMQEQVQRHLQESESSKNQKPEGGVLKFASKKVMWRSFSSDASSKQKELNKSIQELDEEAEILRKKVSELSGQMNLINKQLEYKEKEQRSLEKDLENVKIKVESDESMLTERQRQYKQLEETAKQRLGLIEKNIEEKEKETEELSTKLERVSQSESSLESQTSCLQADSEEDLVPKLEDEIVFLEHEIIRLRRELKDQDLGKLNT